VVLQQGQPPLTPLISATTAAAAAAAAAGAIGNNNQGVSGVCQSGLKIISAKFLGPNGGSTDAAVLALDYLWISNISVA
jgi:hypothetical protein